MRLKARGLGHAYALGSPLFSGLDLDLAAGQVWAVTGPSGSGKSTLLGILAGWITPSLGSVDRPIGMSTGWVLQHPVGVARRNALDHVALPFLARGATRAAADAAAEKLLADFGLAHRVGAAFAQLSGGEAQRLMLARGLAAAPDLLLVDEPTAQLDARTAAAVSDSLAAMSGRSSIVVIATHDPRVRDACPDAIDLAAYQ